MTSTEAILTDAFERVRGVVHRVLDGLDEAALTARPTPTANSIGWLVWHLTRIQDDHVADLAGVDQRWTAGGWAARFGLPFDDDETGYAQSSDDVAAVRGVPAEVFAGYLDAVHAATVAYLRGIDEAELSRVVDTAWDPPVTAAVRLVSVVSDDLQHAGQAAYVKGLLD